MFWILKKLFNKRESASISDFKQTVPVDKVEVSTIQTTNDIVQMWKLTDLKLNVPATGELLNDAQQRIGYIFPEDFIRFYEQMNGFKNWDVIGDMFSIWPLERILENYEKSEDQNFVPFCDYCIDSHRIGYLKDEAGIFKDYDQVNKIADTFEETTKLILAYSNTLY